MWIGKKPTRLESVWKRISKRLEMSNIGHWVTGIALIKGRDTCGVVIGFRSRSMHRDLIPRCFSHIDFQNVFSSRKGKFSSCRSFITKENIIISRFLFSGSAIKNSASMGLQTEKCFHKRENYLVVVELPEFVDTTFLMFLFLLFI